MKTTLKTPLIEQESVAQSQTSTQEHLPMFEGGDDAIPDIDLINKPAPKLKVAIVGYGPSGCAAAIGLARQGHDVTIFERSFYNYKDKSDESTLDRSLMYPVNIGCKGLEVLDWMRCMPIFKHHLNEYDGIKDAYGNWLPAKELRPSFMGTHLEIMWAFHHALDVCAPQVRVHQRSKVVRIDVYATTITYENEEGVESTSEQFDLIIGADGAGSCVRRSMDEQIEDFEAKKWEGEAYVKSCYFDNREQVKKILNPREAAARNIVGSYPMIIAPIKFENNETAVGAILKNKKDISTKEEARRFLQSIHPETNLMITDKGLDLFLKAQSRNIFKTVRCNRYHNNSNIVLIGDAAHPFPPVGQGINIAMLDSMWLCQLIENNPHDIGRALSLFTEKSMLQANPIIDITLESIHMKYNLRDLLASGMGLQEGVPAAEWKKLGPDYKYVHGYWKSSKRALWLLMELFLLVNFITMMCLGTAWFEGFKIMGVNFFLCGAFCFYFMSQNKMVGKKLYLPLILCLLAAGGVAYQLESVQQLLQTYYTQTDETQSVTN